MKFRVTKIAAAVAVGLGVSMAGVNTAQATTRIMFPYVGASDTVTTIVTVINRYTGVIPGGQGLHYQIFTKAGNDATDAGLGNPCQEASVFRPTSVNDIVTFDLSGHFGDANGVLFEPKGGFANRSYSFFESILAGIPEDQPRMVRGWLMVDNLGTPALPVGTGAVDDLHGEALLMDFVEGASWGYVAYQPSIGANSYDFSDSVENQGEVVAGGYAYTDAAIRSNVVGPSPRVPFAIYPLQNGDITSQLTVTPINHDVINVEAPGGLASPAGPLARFPAVSDVSGRFGQNAQSLKTRIGLSVLPAGASLVAYDRDEGPIDGNINKDVTCVGAVRIDSLFSSFFQEQLANGGWSSFRVTSPGPLIQPKSGSAYPAPGPLPATAVTTATGTRTLNTNQAIVMKLEYNEVGSFGGESFNSAYNNGFWLRRGPAESRNVAFPIAAAVPFRSVAAVTEEAQVGSLYTQLGVQDPITDEISAVGPTYKVGDVVTFIQ